MEKKKKVRAIIGVIKKWIIGLFWGLCLAYLFCLCLPKVFGLKVGVVKSGSMEPSIATGSVVYVRPNRLETIKTGNVIAFYKEKVTVIHRVVGLDESKEGYVTKGDNNEIQDATPVPFSKVIGKVIFHIPYLGYLYAWIEGKRVLFLWIVLCFSCVSSLKKAVRVRVKTKQGKDSKHETDQISHIE